MSIQTQTQKFGQFETNDPAETLRCGHCGEFVRAVRGTSVSCPGCGGAVVS